MFFIFKYDHKLQEDGVVVFWDEDISRVFRILSFTYHIHVSQFCCELVFFQVITAAACVTNC